MKKVVEFILLLVGVLFVSCTKEIKLSPKVEIKEISATEAHTYCVLKVTDSGKSPIKKVGVCINTEKYRHGDFQTPLRGQCEYQAFETPGSNGEEITVDITGKISGTTYIKPYVEKKSGAIYGETRLVEKIGNLKIENISSSSVELSAVACGTFSEYGFCYSTGVAPTLSQAHLACGSNGGGNYRGEITNLNRGTLYHVRAYAKEGASVLYGREISFTTTN